MKIILYCLEYELMFYEVMFTELVVVQILHYPLMIKLRNSFEIKVLNHSY